MNQFIDGIYENWQNGLEKIPLQEKRIRYKRHKVHLWGKKRDRETCNN